MQPLLVTAARASRIMAAVFPGFAVTICGIPKLDAHSAAGVTHVLSILDPDWPDPPAFAAFSPHRRLALRFNDVIEAGAGSQPPTTADVAALLGFGREEISGVSGVHLLIHCHAGISRSTASAA